MRIQTDSTTSVVTRTWSITTAVVATIITAFLMNILLMKKSLSLFQVILTLIGVFLTVRGTALISALTTKSPKPENLFFLAVVTMWSSLPTSLESLFVSTVRSQKLF